VLANEIQPRTRGSWKDGPARLRCVAEGGEKDKRLMEQVNDIDLRFIKFGIGTEIRNALKIFCDSSRLEVYRLVAFRRFCLYLLR